MSRLSTTIPRVPVHPDELVEFVRGAGDVLPGTRLWQGQSYAFETTAAFAYLAGRGLARPFGTCVTVAPLQHPVRAALDARSLSLLAGRSVIYGIGPGPAGLQEELLDERYARPVEQLGGYVRRMRAALLQLDHDGDGLPLPDDGAGPGLGGPLAPVPAPPSLIGLGVLRPAMARLAGRAADAAITWLSPPEHLQHTLWPQVVDAAAEAGRPAPRRIAMVAASVVEPGRDALAMTHHAVGGHLQHEHYRAALAAAGVDLGTDYADQLRAMIRSGVALVGSARHVSDGVTRLLEGGADEVVLHLSGTATAHGLEAALDDLRAIEQVVATRAGTGTRTGEESE